MSDDLQPDPSVIGGVPKPPFVFLPTPVQIFKRRAKRFAFLSESNKELAPYLSFLAALTGAQTELTLELPPLPALDAEQVARAKSAQMPPLDRNAILQDPALLDTVHRFLEAATALEMPEPARLALSAVKAASPEDMKWLLTNVLTDQIPEDSTAPHMFVAAAVQIHMTRRAAQLDAENLVPIRTGVCPCCGGAPASSEVITLPGIDNLRYAVCATCATRWNEVRVKCLCCGTNKGLSYRSAETTEATVKAESCSECGSWIKIFYSSKNPSIDPIADDVASLGLDMMMKTAGSKRGSFNPYLTGY